MFSVQTDIKDESRTLCVIMFPENKVLMVRNDANLVAEIDEMVNACDMNVTGKCYKLHIKTEQIITQSYLIFQ